MLGLQQSQPFLARAIPAAFFNDFSSLPATYFPEFFKFLFMVRLLHKLGDADRRLTRQDRLFGHRWGRMKMETASNSKLQMLLWVFALHHSLHHFPSALFIPKPDT